MVHEWTLQSSGGMYISMRTMKGYVQSVIPNKVKSVARWDGIVCEALLMSRHTSWAYRKRYTQLKDNGDRKSSTFQVSVDFGGSILLSDSK